MTRVNCINPRILRDDHLGAEYREIARLPALVVAAAMRGESPTDRRNPTRYRLGAGHVRFFYPRLGYIYRRFADLVAECRARGRAVNYPTLPFYPLAPEWFDDWTPAPPDRHANINRIEHRGGLRQ